MRRVKSVPAVLVITVLSILLAIAIISTVVLALFSTTKKATVTLKFAESVEVEVEGIAKSDTKYTWNIATAANTTTNLTDSAVVSAPFFESIKVKVINGATAETPVVVRVFAIVYTTNSKIESITASSGVTVVTDYTTQEKGLISTVPKVSNDTQYEYTTICMTKEFTTTGTTFTDMTKDFYPLTKELSESNLGAKTQGIVVVSAKVRSQGQTIATTEWNDVLDFEKLGIKWAD